ncbi:PD-(D/E)XK nuclease family protein [bacterium]|nr:PD-(D/E)XK nuclease family protein [bacterium]
MDYIQGYLKEILIFLVWVIFVIILYLKIFGKKVFGQFSDKILKMEGPDFIVTGKPDRIIRKNRHVVIYEYKSRKAPKNPYNDHILQLGSYFLLFERTYKKKVAFGIIKYRDKEFRIENSESLKSPVIKKINNYLSETSDPKAIRRNHHNYGKCHNCQYKGICRQCLTQ